MVLNQLHNTSNLLKRPLVYHQKRNRVHEMLLFSVQPVCVVVVAAFFISMMLLMCFVFIRRRRRSISIRKKMYACQIAQICTLSAVSYDASFQSKTAIHTPYIPPKKFKIEIKVKKNSSTSSKIIERKSVKECERAWKSMKEGDRERERISGKDFNKWRKFLNNKMWNCSCFHMPTIKVSACILLIGVECERQACSAYNNFSGHTYTISTTAYL